MSPISRSGRGYLVNQFDKCRDGWYLAQRNRNPISDYGVPPSDYGDCNICSSSNSNILPNTNTSPYLFKLGEIVYPKTICLNDTPDDTYVYQGMCEEYYTYEPVQNLDNIFGTPGDSNFYSKYGKCQ